MVNVVVCKNNLEIHGSERLRTILTEEFGIKAESWDIKTCVGYCESCDTTPTVVVDGTVVFEVGSK